MILLLNNGGGALLSFGLAVLIGRGLGEENFGVYTTALAWVYPLALVAEFGLGTLITREVAQDLAAAPEFLHAAARARGFIGGGLMLALIVGAPLLTNDLTLIHGLQISAPMIVIVPMVGAFTAVFRARQAMWPVTWLNLGMLVAQVILTALVLLAGGGVLVALAVNVATSGGQWIAAWGIYRRGFMTESTWARRASPLQVGQLLRQAAPFALAAVLAAVQMRVGVVMLEASADITQVGYYAAASRFTDAARMIPNALFGALLPALSAGKIERQLFQRIMFALVGYSSMVFAAVALLAPVIIQVTFGEPFAPAELPLGLLALALLPSLLRSARTLYWYAQGREAYVNRTTAIMLVVQVGVSLIAVQAGAAGLAGAMVVAEWVGLGLLYVVPREQGK